MTQSFDHETPSVGVPGPPEPRVPRWRDRIGILRPLSIRDFALLWTGMAVSLVGDGIYFIAIAWEVYRLSNAPTALSVVGVAWTLPMVVFLLIGGVASDRFDRRVLMIAADIARAVAIGTMGVLSLLGVLELWHVIALVTLFGVGEAFFSPAFSAIVPQIVPRDLLVEANSLNGFVRPAAMFMIGPAVGGFLVAAFGAGVGFLVDAASFLMSAVAISLITARTTPRASGERSRPLSELREAFVFVRSEPWLWATLASAAIVLLLFWGPLEVLVPYFVKNDLNGSAADLGFVFAAGGVGALVASLLMGQLGLPRRHILFMYLVWAAAVSTMVLFALASDLSLAVLARLLGGGLGTAGMVVWNTLMHRLVPNELLGRVASFDWFVSIALVPVSFAITGPVAEAIGIDATFVWAGALGAAATLAFLAIPGIRETETDGRMAVATGEGAEARAT